MAPQHPSRRKIISTLPLIGKYPSPDFGNCYGNSKQIKSIVPLNAEIRAVKCQERILCQNRHRGLAVIVETHPVKHKASSYMSMFSSNDN